MQLQVKLALGTAIVTVTDDVLGPEELQDRTNAILQAFPSATTAPEPKPAERPSQPAQSPPAQTGTSGQGPRGTITDGQLKYAQDLEKEHPQKTAELLKGFGVPSVLAMSKENARDFIQKITGKGPAPRK